MLALVPGVRFAGALGSQEAAEATLNDVVAKAFEHYQAGSHGQAIQLLEEGLEHHPLDRRRPSASKWLAFALMASNRHSDALAILDAGMAEVEGEWARGVPNYEKLFGECELLLARAQVYYGLGLLDLQARTLRELGDRARVLIEVAAEEVPTWPVSTHHTQAAQLAELYLVVDRYDEIEELCDEHVDGAAISPGDRHTLLKCRALAKVKETVDLEADPGPARNELASLLNEPGLSTIDLADAHLAGAWLDLLQGRLTMGASALTPARTLLEAQTDRDWYRLAWLEAMETLAARQRGASHEDLRVCRERLENACDRVFDGWRNGPVRAGGIGFLHLRMRRMMLGELVSVCLAMNEPEAALAHALTVQSMGTIARLRDLAVPDLAEIRAELLGEHDGLLIFLPSEERSHLFVIDGESLTCEPLPAERKLRTILDDLVREVCTRPGPGVEADALLLERAAEAILPEAVRARIRSWDHCYVVGRSLMRGAPLEALPFDGARTFGEAVASVDLPSVPVGLWLARRQTQAPPPATDLALFYGPDDVKPALPLTDEHQDRLVSPFDGQRTSVYRGVDVTLDNLRSAARERPATLHLMMHGQSSEELERPACLPMSQSSTTPLLTCDLVESIPMPGHVILSACGAARGRARLGEDSIQHLGGAFLQAGSHTVVLSAADLPLDPTFALAQSYHSFIAKGHTPAEAMRRARIDVARVSDWNHPYYHSLLYVHGLGTRALHESDSRRPWWLVAVAGLIVGGLLGTVVRRRARRTDS